MRQQIWSNIWIQQTLRKKRAIDLSLLPTLPALYADPEVLAKNAWFKNMVDVFKNAVARPSTVTGADYNQISTSFFQNVNKVLTGWRISEGSRGAN